VEPIGQLEAAAGFRQVVDDDSWCHHVVLLSLRLACAQRCQRLAAAELNSASTFLARSKIRMQGALELCQHRAAARLRVRENLARRLKVVRGADEHFRREVPLLLHACDREVRHEVVRLRHEDVCERRPEPLLRLGRPAEAVPVTAK
jgi:hypothetical protein